MITGFIPTAAVDVVGVFDAGFQQLFGDARPIKATVKEASKAMEHPIESGATMIDHRIILPVEIELKMMLAGATYRDTYRQIREMFRKGDTLTVQTKAGSYANMLIAEMPHEEAPDALGTLVLTLKLKEVQVVTARYEKLSVRKVRDKTHASTVQRGEQSGKPAKRKASTLHDIFV
ncbi:phage baseplate protein [Mycetohabitans sp. B46]|uniref:phage baseplate protein n=1 Tax=Mycetohabitans sp. B46 TaxID=2772536 RepID=UPI00307DECC5